MMEHMNPECPLPATDREILLASHSPRRRQLMSMIVDGFSVVTLADVDESYPAGMPVVEVAPYLSRLKSEAYGDNLKPGQILITADTVVISDMHILGKPHDYDEAYDMLRCLSGREHEVMTGVTLSSVDRTETFAQTTRVIFGRLTDSQIHGYIKACKPYDKAGAYGIQEWIGAIGIESINGDYYNVMGLPVSLLYHKLKMFALL